MLHERLSLALLAGLPCTTAAQQVHIVDDDGGPGVDYTSLEVAIDNASAGDTLLVAPGKYVTTVGADFLVDQPLRIVGTAPGVQIRREVRVEGISVGETCVFRGIDFFARSASASSLYVTGCQGAVWFEDCTMNAAGAPQDFEPYAIRVDDCVDVAFTRCEVIPPNLGLMFPPYGNETFVLRAGSSHVTLRDTTLAGAQGGFPLPACGIGGQTALSLSSSRAFVSGSTLQGGQGASQNQMPACSPGDGAPGVSLISESTITLIESTVAGGPPGADFGVGGANPGEPFAYLGSTSPDDVELLDGAARHYEAISVASAGEAATWTLEGEPGDVAVLLLAYGGGWSELSGVIGPLAVGGPVVIAPPIPLVTGDLALAFTAPQLPPGLDVLALYVQAAFLDGVDIHLGPASGQTLLP